MTARHAPAGTKLKQWAERHCSADTLESLVLPVVADLQYEDSSSVGRPNVYRRLIRLRGYIAIAKVIGLHCLHHRRAHVMARKPAPARVAGSSAGWSSIMSEPNRNAVLVGAGLLIAAVAFAGGRLSAPTPTPATDTRFVSSIGSGEDYRALQRSVDEQRREAAERDRKIQQELAQQRFDIEMERTKADRARIDAETELGRQRTQQMIDELNRRQ